MSQQDHFEQFSSQIGEVVGVLDWVKIDPKMVGRVAKSFIASGLIH